MTYNRGIALTAAAILAVAAYTWWPSEERVIRRRLNEIAARISVPANEADLARVTRVVGIRDYLAPDLHVRYGTAEATSRETILGALAQWGRSADGVTVEFVDVNLTLDAANRDTARAYMTVKVTSKDSVDAKEADVGLARVDGVWIVTSAESKETLSR